MSTRVSEPSLYHISPNERSANLWFEDFLLHGMNPQQKSGPPAASVPPVWLDCTQQAFSLWYWFVQDVGAGSWALGFRCFASQLGVRSQAMLLKWWRLHAAATASESAMPFPSLDLEVGFKLSPGFGWGGSPKFENVKATDLRSTPKTETCLYSTTDAQRQHPPKFLGCQKPNPEQYDVDPWLLHILNTRNGYG